MSAPQSTLRLFVAVYPPPEIADGMLEAAADLARRLDLPPRRMTPTEQVHVTVHFIGPTPLHDLDRAIESVERAAAGLPAAECRPRRLVSLPRRGPKRLVAAEADMTQSILEVQRRLALRFARPARRRPGDRFLPHLTLLRFRAPARIEPIDAPLALPAFTVREIGLMRSTLHPDGARHEEVVSVSLSDGRG